MRNIMLDIETLGTRPSSVVLSIGAVEFCKHTPGKFGRKFYAVLDIWDQSLHKGRTKSKDTEEWWSKQPEAARVILTTEDRMPVPEALDKLFDFIGLPGDHKIWGNGSDFDNVIVSELFQSYGLETPWLFWDNRCFRTFKSEFGHLVEKPKFKGTAHNALDDAINQAEHCQLIFAKLSQLGVICRE